MPEPDVGASARLPLLGRGRDGEFHGDKAKVVCGIPSLPETSSSHLKMYGWNTTVPFWEAIFSGAMLVSGRVGNSDSSFLVPYVVNDNVSRFQVGQESRCLLPIQRMMRPCSIPLKWNLDLFFRFG